MYSDIRKNKHRNLIRHFDIYTDWYVRLFNELNFKGVSFTDWYKVVKNIPIDALVVFYKPIWVFGKKLTHLETFKLQLEYLSKVHGYTLEPILNSSSIRIKEWTMVLNKIKKLENIHRNPSHKPYNANTIVKWKIEV